jgi:hypothetical protein
MLPAIGKAPESLRDDKVVDAETNDRAADHLRRLDGDRVSPGKSHRDLLATTVS